MTDAPRASGQDHANPPSYRRRMALGLVSTATDIVSRAQSERSEIVALLGQGDTQLLTIVGPVGVGKPAWRYR